MDLNTVRPAPSDFNPFYAGYVAAVADADLNALLPDQPRRLTALCASLTDDEARFRYAPEKWSIKEVLGHMADAERVFSYRLFRISRGDATPLARFDENAYVAQAGADDQPVARLLDDFAAARAATCSFLEGVTLEQMQHRGSASGWPVTAAALVHIVAGHAEHHVRILQDRYGLR